MEQTSVPPPENQRTLLLAESRHIGWDHLKHVLDSRPELRIIADATHPDEAVRLAHRLQPDLILVAVEPRAPWSSEIVARLESPSPSSRVMALVDRSDTALAIVREHVHVCGLLTWESTEDDYILPAIEAVEAGFRVVSRELGEALAAGIEGQASAPPLTDREVQVLAGLLDDKLEDEIAGEMAVETRTVRGLVKGLKAKFGVRPQQGLVCRAMESGFGRGDGTLRIPES